MGKSIIFITLFIFSIETIYFSSDDIWEYSKQQILSKNFPPQYFTIDLYKYLDANTINEMLNTQKYIYEKYNIPNYVFFVSRLDLKKASLEKTVFEISKKICKEYHFHCDRSIIVLFSIENRIFRIRTGAEIKDSILTNYMCEQILNKLKPFLRKEKYSQVHRNLLIDIRNNLDFPEKYKKNSDFLKHPLIIISILFVVFFVIIIIVIYDDIKYRKLNKIKTYLKNCKNNKKIPTDMCVICLDNLTSNESIAIECRHQFHKKCIELWMKKNSICPLCRNKLQIDNLNKNYSLNDQDNSNYQNSLLDINLRNLWDIQQILNPNYESISYNSLYETHRSYSDYDYNDNDHDYNWSNNDNDHDRDYGGGASSSW
jgi:hypothetical protein